MDSIVPLNIVDLIENNPITRLSPTYQSSLLRKIKEKFTDTEQQMFVSSFYCYLNYNQKNDFVIDLDDVWKWIGFATKQKAKLLLEKQFMLNVDYKLLLNQQVKQVDQQQGGHNKEKIMLTIRTFKLFCLKAGTKKAEQVHEYYINLEEILQEIVEEESSELKLQLETQIILSVEEKLIIREKTLLEQFGPNTQCFYYGFIDNVSNKNERLIKFGNSNFLKNRVMVHKNTYLNFRLVNVFKVDNKIQIENAMKDSPLFKSRQRTLVLSANGKKYMELLSIDGLTLDELDKTIKDIITQLEYSPQNYIKILEENRELKKKIESANKINQTDTVFIMQMEHTRLKMENLKLIKRYKALIKKTNETINGEDIIVAEDVMIADDIMDADEIITQHDVNNYNSVVSTLKKIMKNSEGVYAIGGKKYKILEGTRQEVWDGKAYKTSGGLLKHNFLINKLGHIVSKRKSMFETENNRFVASGVNNPPNVSSE